MTRRGHQVLPPLQVVTGKGGVGKSTFAAALALAAAREGYEVLALELGGPGGLAATLDVKPSEHGVPVPAAPGVHVAWYDGEAALAEYLLRFMPFGSRFKPFFAHPLYRAFVSAGPGVRELMAIGKVRDELLGLSTGERRWDLIVLDAGASGHALQLLGMPAATARTFSSGLAHRESSKVAAFLADPTQTAVHVVTLPEVMPLEEAAEVIERLRGELALPVGRLVVNRCRPAPPPGAEEAVASLQDASAGAAAQATATTPDVASLRVSPQATTLRDVRREGTPSQGTATPDVSTQATSRQNPAGEDASTETMPHLRGATPTGLPGSTSATDQARHALAVASRRALAWERLQEAGIAALEGRVMKPAQRLPALIAEPFGRPELERLAAQLLVEEAP